MHNTVDRAQSVSREGAQSVSRETEILIDLGNENEHFAGSSQGNSRTNARIPRGGWLQNPFEELKFSGREDAQNPLKFLRRFETIARRSRSLGPALLFRLMLARVCSSVGGDSEFRDNNRRETKIYRILLGRGSASAFPGGHLQRAIPTRLEEIHG